MMHGSQFSVLHPKCKSIFSRRLLIFFSLYFDPKSNSIFCKKLKKAVHRDDIPAGQQLHAIIFAVRACVFYCTPHFFLTVRTIKIRPRGRIMEAPRVNFTTTRRVGEWSRVFSTPTCTFLLFLSFENLYKSHPKKGSETLPSRTIPSGSYPMACTSPFPSFPTEQLSLNRGSMSTA